MSSFKRMYVVLGILLLAGIAGSLLTPSGVNEGVGTFSAGLTIGVLIAIYVLRTAELRSTETTSTSHLNFHDIREAPAADEQDADIDPSDEVVIDDSPGEEPDPMKPRNASNLLMFNSLDTPAQQPEVQVVEVDGQPEQVPADSCACACGCQLRSKGGVIDLCGNCKRWFQQQSVRCTCDSMVSDYCTCGAMKHQPARRQVEYVAAA